VTIPKTGLALATSPHIHSAVTVDVIMRNVVYAMLPLGTFAVFQFGLSAFLLILTCTATCVLAEDVFWRLLHPPETRGERSPIRDWSAVITGMLLALTLPPGFPLWMAAVGGVISIGLGKAIFGGIGFNVFNPALVGRAFLQAAFPVAITTWTPAGFTGRLWSTIPTTLTFPFAKPPSLSEWTQGAVDGFTGATPLSLQKFDHVGTDAASLFLGTTAGSTGETCAVLVLLCGGYLIARRMMDWRIPAAMLGSAALFAALFHAWRPDDYPGPVFVLFSGGLMLGAMFMASDMVASPVTPLGVWIYGGLMGFLTVLIRFMGGLPEGVMYAILLGNALSPIIDSLTQPKIYGARKPAMAKEEGP
jgi:Na+-translocating ferredoxin:NAD+ oxidoreductase subunit D